MNMYLEIRLSSFFPLLCQLQKFKFVEMGSLRRRPAAESTDKNYNHGQGRHLHGKEGYHLPFAKFHSSREHPHACSQVHGLGCNIRDQIVWMAHRKNNDTAMGKRQKGQKLMCLCFCKIRFGGGMSIPKKRGHYKREGAHQSSRFWRKNALGLQQEHWRWLSK